MTVVQTQTRKYGKFLSDPNEKMTLKHFYLMYPYKKRTCITCLPYLTNDEISDHAYALTYQQWRNIIVTYLKHLVLHLLSGQVYRFSSLIGELQLIKWKPKKKRIDIHTTLTTIMAKYNMTKEEAGTYYKEHKEEGKRYMNKHIDGYKWAVIWRRTGYNAKYLGLWGLMLHKQGAYGFINKYFKENPNHIQQISEP